MRLLRCYLREALHEAAGHSILDRLSAAKTRDEARSILGGLRLLGTGAGREVYDLGDGTVAKLAINNNGLQQNEAEASRGGCASEDAPIVKVLRADDAFNWIQCTKVEPIEGKALDRAVKAVVGLADCEELGYAIDAGLGTFPDDEDLAKLVPVHQRLYASNDWYRALFDACKACGIDPAELHGGNWGLDEDGDLVLLDAGG
jgi:hypothetical protein